MGAAFMSHREGCGRIETASQQHAASINERLAGVDDEELTRAFQPGSESANRSRFGSHDEAHSRDWRLNHGARPPVAWSRSVEAAAAQAGQAASAARARAAFVQV